MLSYKNYIAILKQELVPALGCTEPIAVAYSVAIAKKHVEGKLESIEINVDKHLYKNAMGVTIPNTEEKGIPIAAAMAYIMGNPDAGLEVLNKVRPENVSKAKKLLALNIIKLKVDYEKEGLFIHTKVKTDKGEAEVIIKDRHTNVVKIMKNDSIVMEANTVAHKAKKSYNIKENKIVDFIEFAKTVDIEEIRFLHHTVEMNSKAAQVGMHQKCGNEFGRSLLDSLKEWEQRENSFSFAKEKAKILTTAAADARMSGANAPVMSIGGSGNQGIAATVPIIAFGRCMGLSQDTILRALALSGLVTVYSKAYLGVLSDVCGCAVAAGLGAAAGIAFMLKPEQRVVEGAVKNVIGSISGMICDGAKGGCALKLMVSAATAIECAYLASKGHIIDCTDGIIGETVEKSIRNLGFVSLKGMTQMGDAIIHIMEDKGSDDQTNSGCVISNL